MSYTMEFQDKDGYLLAIIQGKIDDLDLGLQYAQRIMKKTLKSNHNRLLVCEDRFDVCLDTFDTIAVVDSLIKAMPKTKSVRIASVTGPERLSKHRLLETVLRNRSLNYRIFNSIKEAEAWLLS